MAFQAGPSRPRQHNPGDVARRVEEEAELYRTIATLVVRDRDSAPLSDTDLAIRLAREEAEALESINNDRTIARLLERTDEDDWPLITGLQTATAPPVPHTPAVTQTHMRGIQGPPNNPPASGGNQSGGSWLGSLVTAVSSWFVQPTRTEDSGNSPITQASATVPRSNQGRLTGHNCVICQDPIRGVEIRAPCGDYYDKACILELFQASTRDESLYPPRCCRQNIPLSSVRHHMTSKLRSLYQEKSTEFGTLKRVYCANPTCSRFLGPQSDGDFFFSAPARLRCPASGCDTVTCGGCKSRADHGYHRCKKDEKEQEVLDLSQRAGWQRCPGCEQLIELNTGCYHMTCRCRTEFCYLCRARWKSCVCTQWDERRLYAAAEARVDAHLGRNAAAPRVVPAPPVARPPAAPAHPHVAQIQPPAPAPPPAPLPPARAPVVNLSQTQPPRAVAPVVTSAARPHASRPMQAPPPYPAYVNGQAPPAYTRRSAVMWSTLAHTRSSAADTRSFGFFDDSDSEVPALEDTEPSSTQVRAASPSYLTHGRGTSSAAPARHRASGSGTSSTASASHRASGYSTSSATSPSHAIGKQQSRPLSYVSPGAPRLDLTSSSTTQPKGKATTTAKPATNASKKSSATPAPPRPSGTKQSRPKEIKTTSQMKSSAQVDERLRLIREAMANLRDNHECDHQVWRYRHGGGLCEHCNNELPIFLMRCTKCEILACKRCQKNRL